SDPSKWCDFNPQPPIDTDKAFRHPDGYGITGTYGCFEDDAGWPGGFCMAPGTRTWRVRLFQDGQDSLWFKRSTDEYGATASVLNGIGWTVSRVGNNTYNMAVHTGTVNPDGSGTLGASF